MTPEQLHHQLSQRIFVDYFDGSIIAFNVHSERIKIDFNTKKVDLTDRNHKNVSLKAVFDPDTCYVKGHGFYVSDAPSCIIFDLK